MLGKTTEYAIRALVYIYIQNQKGKRPGYKEIAKEIDSPEQFTAKVLQNLARVQMVSSMKGRGGGFYFEESKSTLSLYEVIKVVEGEKVFSKCGFGLKECDCDSPCPMHEDYFPVREGFHQLATNATIQSLAGKINEHQAILTRQQQ
jgi:Rrf2 family protein